MSRLEAAGKRWNAAREKERALAVELYEAIREAVAGGMTEVEAARVAGVDRMTVRRALGKR
jgi:DNA invertase Pin-like site-specific DNA recombinase